MASCVHAVSATSMGISTAEQTQLGMGLSPVQDLNPSEYAFAVLVTFAIQRWR
jgi:hypothetical protein